jgi:hypothetical protein
MSAALFAMKHWRLIGSAVLLLALGLYIASLKGDVRHWQKLHAREKLAHERNVANFRIAQEQARANAEAAARAEEQRAAQITKEKDRAITLARADADARLREWMRRQKAGADQSGSVRTDLPATAQSSGATDAGADSTFLVAGEDLRRCNAAYVTAKGWQDWWQAIEKGN